MSTVESELGLSNSDANISRMHQFNKVVSNVERIVFCLLHRRMISVDMFFVFFEIICCVVAICDLVHDVETIFHLSYVLTASGNLF